LLRRAARVLGRLAAVVVALGELAQTFENHAVAWVARARVARVRAARVVVALPVVAP
jgi:hypothetical protein